MKLAEVAAGGQQWNFENLPEEPSTPCDEMFEAGTEATNMNSGGGANLSEVADNYKNGDNSILEDVEDESEDMQCNGHDQEGDPEQHEVQKNGGVIINSAELTAEVAAANEAAAAAVAAEVNNGQLPASLNATARPPILCASTTENKIDPVTEIAPDLQVKIADLGNACWVVSTYIKIFFLAVLIFFLFFFFLNKELLNCIIYNISDPPFHRRHPDAAISKS